MAVAFSANSTAVAEFNPATATSSTTNMTVKAGDTALVVTISLGLTAGTIASTGISVTAMTWNSVAMTLLGTATASDGTCLVSLYGLASPATGNHTISATIAGTLTNCSGYIDGASFTGTDTTTSTCFPSGNVIDDVSAASAGGLYPSSPFSVTTVSGDMAVATMNDVVTGFGATTSGDGTIIHADSNLQGNCTWAYKAAAGASTAIQFAGSANGDACCGVAIRIIQPGGVTLMAQIWM